MPTQNDWTLVKWSLIDYWKRAVALQVVLTSLFFLIFPMRGAHDRGFVFNRTPYGACESFAVGGNANVVTTRVATLKQKVGSSPSALQERLLDLLSNSKPQLNRMVNPFDFAEQKLFALFCCCFFRWSTVMAAPVLFLERPWVLLFGLLTTYLFLVGIPSHLATCCCWCLLFFWLLPFSF